MWRCIRPNPHPYSGNVRNLISHLFLTALFLEMFVDPHCNGGGLADYYLWICKWIVQDGRMPAARSIRNQSNQFWNYRLTQSSSKLSFAHDWIISKTFCLDIFYFKKNGRTHQFWLSATCYDASQSTWYDAQKQTSTSKIGSTWSVLWKRGDFGGRRKWKSYPQPGTASTVNEWLWWPLPPDMAPRK